MGLIGQSVDGCRLLGVTILVSVAQRVFESREVLFDTAAGVFAKQGGDHMHELTSRGTILQRHTHDGASVRPGLEADRVFVLDALAHRALGDQFVRLVIDDLRIPLDVGPHRALHDPVRPCLRPYGYRFEIGHDEREVAEVAPEAIDLLR